MRWRADDLLAVDQTAITKTANTERQLCGTTGNLRSRPLAVVHGRPLNGRPITSLQSTHATMRFANTPIGGRRFSEVMAGRQAMRAMFD